MPKYETTIKILIIDDELPIREVLSATLQDEGYIVQTAHDADSGLRAMKDFLPDIVFLDIWMPGSLDGIEVLTQARREFKNSDFIMISGHGNIETAVRATKLGAWDFIEKPLSMDKILISISNIAHYQKEKIEKMALLNRLRRSLAIVGEAPKMMLLKESIARIASAQSWILLTGEHGSGKELVAENIHYMSERAGRPFVQIVCSNLVDDLIELELFGYEAHSIPGAEKSKTGKIEMAQGGTLFLEDLADLSLKAQGVFIKLLTEKKFSKIGSRNLIDLDVRIIAATEVNLEQQIEKGLLDEKLYHILNVVTLGIPSLREHKEDIRSMISHFSDLIVKDSGYAKKNFSEQALFLMESHFWPGNVRELKNFIERVYILTPAEFVDVLDLRFAGLAVVVDGQVSDAATFREARAHFEKEYLLKKIQENSGNISKTAEVIGLERSYLHRKIKSFGIEIQKGEE